MDVLGRTLLAGVAALAGCYSPAVRDCTVSCTSPSDCASGQICGEDGLCAVPEVAGRCRPGGSDAKMDAAGSDGSALVRLHVQITGNGSVLVAGHGTCSSKKPEHGNCTYDIALGVAQSVFAIELRPSERFAQWTSMTCTGQGTSCTFTPVADTIIVARFESSDDQAPGESPGNASARDARAGAPRSRDAARPAPVLTGDSEFFARRTSGLPVAPDIPHGERDDADQGPSTLGP